MNITKLFLSIYPFTFFINFYFLVLMPLCFSIFILIKRKFFYINSIKLCYLILILINFCYVLFFNIDQYNVLIKYFVLPFLFLIISTKIKIDDQQINELMPLFVFAFTIISLLMFFQTGPYSFDFNRIFTINRNEGYWLLSKDYIGAPAIGGLSGLALILSLILSRLNKKFFFLAFINLTIIILASQRGAFVSAFFTIFYIYLFNNLKIKKSYIFLLIICSIISFIFAYYNITHFSHRIDQLISLSDDSMAGRFLHYKSYLIAISNNIFGHGFTVKISGMTSHNEHIDILFRTGIFGFLMYLIFLLFWFLRAKKNIYLIGAFIYFFVIGLVENFSQSSGSLSYVFYLIFITLTLSYTNGKILNKR